MTLQQMNEYLETQGFDVHRERDSKRDVYIFTISKPGYSSLTKEFKYPKTDDWNYRNMQMEEFLDSMVRSFYACAGGKVTPTDPYQTLQRAILDRDMVELHIGDTIMPAQITNCTVSNCDMDLPTFEGFIDINHATSKRLDRSDMVRDPLPKAYRDYFNADIETTSRMYRYTMYDRTPLPNIKDVIHNDPATIVFWDDGAKTVVKCQPGDKYDPEKGLAMAISKKALGNHGNYYNVFEKWLPEPAPYESVLENLHKQLDRVNTALTELSGNPRTASFRTRDDAKTAINNLEDIIRDYGHATVADWYDICGLKSGYPMGKRGWRNSVIQGGVEILRTRNGYEVKLPPTIELIKAKELEESTKTESNYNPVQKAYDILKGLRDGDDIEEVIDDVIGYLGEALDK